MPKLRFPEFRNSGEWAEYSLEEISSRITEKVGDRSLTPISITAGLGFVSQTEKFGRDIAGQQYKNYVALNKGEFAYNKGNSKKYPQGCIYKLKEYEKVAAPNAFICFRINEEHIPDFYQSYFDANYHGVQLQRFITSGARSDGLLNVSPDDFFSIKFLAPKKKEQQRIADCLSSVDELITAQTQKVDELKAHKKGLMQQLFPAEGETVPKLRFPEFRDAGGWDDTQLEKIASFSKGKGISKADISLNGTLPCIRYGELYTHYNETITSVVSYTDLPSDDLVLSKVNDVIIPASGETKEDIATASCVLKDGIALGGDLNIIRTKMNGVFLSYYMNNAKRTDIAKLAQGISVVHLYSNQLKKLNIYVPELPEQREIADCLSSIDDLITAQAQKVEALKAHKKGLMQQLFPSPDEANG